MFIKLFIRNVIMRFGRIARWADLVLGLGTIGAGIYWQLWWMIALGVFSLVAFAFNLNGRIQTWAQAKAVKHVQKRSQS